MNVRGQVLGEIVGPGEALAARLAVVRPLSGVDAQMAGQIRFAAEGASAEQADKRTFSCMLAHVQLQVLLGADALATEGACEARCGGSAKEVRSCEFDYIRIIKSWQTGSFVRTSSFGTVQAALSLFK